MSATIYAGSMQYAALDLISGGASLITCALMTLMINARHFFYGLSMLDKYQDAGQKKPYLIFALTDETYSLVCTPSPRRHRCHQLLFLGVPAGSDLLDRGQRHRRRTGPHSAL